MPATTASDSIGVCPRCEGPIPARNVLIRYRRAASVAVYAECPDCETPVRPA